MTSLRVEACGPGASVQDFGRSGYRRFGVAAAGAVDRVALAAANALCGNAADMAAIEVVLSGATFSVHGEEIAVAVAGVGIGLSINGRRVAPGSSCRASDGEQITVSVEPGALYGYLACAGGISTKPEMGSRSVHARSGIGGSALRPGAFLPLGAAMPGPLRRLVRPLAAETGPIRVMPGPQDDWFAPAALKTFLTSEYTVHPRSDRMGRRLAGPLLPHANGYNIVTDGVVPGAIQVPGDGLPLVLMRDCQTAGGYPKIATVISADLDRMAQTPPGRPVRFVAVSMDEALAAARSLAARIDAMAGNVEPLPEPDDHSRLLRENLIGGVTDGSDPASG